MTKNINRPLSIALALLVVMAIASVTSCTNDDSELDYGIHPEHASFVPARIAVLPCRIWPNGARFAGLPLTTVNRDEQNGHCAQFDRFVLEGFEGQPFMRGISPKTVAETLEEKKTSYFIKELDQLWQHREADCQECRSAPTFYRKSIAHRKKWRLWLTEMSRAIRNADAALIPFLTFAYQKSFNDRGILVHKKVAGVVLLLIDTNNGYLLWAGGRQAEASNQVLAETAATPPPQEPNLEELYQRLLTDDIWKEFPGRQVYH